MIVCHCKLCALNFYLFCDLFSLIQQLSFLLSNAKHKAPKIFIIAVFLTKPCHNNLRQGSGLWQRNTLQSSANYSKINKNDQGEVPVVVQTNVRQVQTTQRHKNIKIKKLCGMQQKYVKKDCLKDRHLLIFKLLQSSNLFNSSNYITIGFNYRYTKHVMETN